MKGASRPFQANLKKFINWDFSLYLITEFVFNFT